MRVATVAFALTAFAISNFSALAQSGSEGSGKAARKEACRAEIKGAGGGASREQKIAYIRECMQRGRPKEAASQSRSAQGGSKEARREACRAERRIALKGANADDAQKKAYIRECMQRSKG